MDGNSTDLGTSRQRTAIIHSSSSVDFSKLENLDPQVREAEARRWMDCNVRWIGSLVRKIRKRWSILGEDELTMGDVSARVLQRLRNGPLCAICPLGSAELEANWRAYWRTVAHRLAMARARRKWVEESRRMDRDAFGDTVSFALNLVISADSQAAMEHRLLVDLEHAEVVARRHLPVRQCLLLKRVMRAARNGSETHREIGRASGVSHVTVGTIIAQARAAVLRDSGPSRRLDPGCRPN